MATSKDTAKPYGFVYLITNTVNGKIYVGQTIRSIAARWNSHCTFAKKGRESRLMSAIRKYGPQAFTITELCRAGSQPELNALEIREIARRGSMDELIGYNMHQGGIGGTISEEIKAKISATLKGRHLTPEQHERLLAANGTPENRLRLSVLNKGRKHTEETRRKVGAASLGRKRSPESIEKSRQAHLGTKRSDEYCAAMSARMMGRPSPNKGKPHSEEWRAALKAAWAKRKARLGPSGGVSHSPESRAKIKASWIIRKRRASEK